MPLTEKGAEIKANMEKEYGEKKGESVFYASRNKGTITGVDAVEPAEKDEDRNIEDIETAVQAAEAALRKLEFTQAKEKREQELRADIGRMSGKRLRSEPFRGDAATVGVITEACERLKRRMDDFAEKAKIR